MERVTYTTRPDGTLRELRIGDISVDMREGTFVGPQFVLHVNNREECIPLVRHTTEKNCFVATRYGLQLAMRYEIAEQGLQIDVDVKNIAKAIFRPSSLGIRMGINGSLERYPDWYDNYFPTFLRCEKTHFTGYCMTPGGDIVTISSPDMVSCWHLDYSQWEENACQEEVSPYLTGGHLIPAFVLSLLHKGPLPERHGVREELHSGETIHCRFYLNTTRDLEAVSQIFADGCSAPFIQMRSYTIQPGERCQGQVFGDCQTLTLVAPSGKKQEIAVDETGFFSVDAMMDELGLYYIDATGSSGRQSQATVYLRKNNMWYVEKSRDEIIRRPPIYTHHMESFNCFHASFLAQRLLPDGQKDEKCNQMFEKFFAEFYDFQQNIAREAAAYRIQDSASMAQLAAEYSVLTGKKEYMKYAKYLADFVVTKQGEDGAFYCDRLVERGTHYTSVTYLAKYLMDVAAIEIATGEAEYVEAGARHQISAAKAAKNLMDLDGNVETEGGEPTFEDGMISCSMLQTGYYALTLDDKALANQYTEAAKRLHDSHKCLSVLVSPDARCSGATIRFWEAQYNLDIFHNLFSSPCGWTAWELYGTWYLYQLTYDLKYLRETMNGLGGCMQLMDVETANLRWAFMIDPYIETERVVQISENPEKGGLAWVNLGEQYLERVSGWHRTDAFPRAKFGIDNLVFEVFKCLGEVSVKNACVFTNESGDLEGYNCSIQQTGNSLTITPFEGYVENLHCNLDKDYEVTVNFAKGAKTAQIQRGWIVTED